MKSQLRLLVFVCGLGILVAGCSRTPPAISTHNPTEEKSPREEISGKPVAPIARGELIRNGNFEQGNVQFCTKYKPKRGDTLDEGMFEVVKNPREAHRDAASFGDHTSGKGYMLVANGGDDAEQVLWAQTVDVRPATDYTFSLWVATWHPGSPAQLEVFINRKSVGKVTAPENCGEWKQFKVQWNGGADKVADIEIFDRNVEFFGNDFAIDDISLHGALPLPGDASQRMNLYEVEAEAILKKADGEIRSRRQKLLEDLQAMEEAYTKAGKLDDAQAIRKRIHQLKTDPDKPITPASSP
jgi:hypothetical protein